MIYIIAAPLLIGLLIGLTLALFIAEQKVAEDLHWLAKALLLPWFWIGFALDVVLINAVLATIVFLECPKWREWTLSARIRRLEHESTGWRWLLAMWVCKGFLRPVDSDHC